MQFTKQQFWNPRVSVWGEKKESRPLPHTHTKNNLQWVIGLNKNAETIIEKHIRKSSEPWNKDVLGHKNHGNNKKKVEKPEFIKLKLI